MRICWHLLVFPEITKFSDVGANRLCRLEDLKSLHHLPNFSCNNMGEVKIPKKTEVGKFKELEKNDCNCCAEHASKNEKGRSCLNTIAALKMKKEYVLLLSAGLLANVLFIAACRFPRFIAKANHIYDDDSGRTVQDIRDSTITSLFVLFNSTGFVVSVAIVISILRSFPLKPWPQISVSLLFVSYMCLIMDILPWESWLVLLLSVPLLLSAAAGKVCKFDE